MAEKDTTAKPPETSNGRKEVSFNYVKSNFFRVIHADGAWGGLSPRGDIHIAFYNERAAIPDFSSLLVSPEGKVVAPEQFEATSELVREVETDVVIDLVTARALQSWLGDKIEELEKRLGIVKREIVKDAR